MSLGRMNKREAESLVEGVLTGPYSEADFRKLVVNIFPDMEPKSDRWTGAYIPEAFRSGVSQYSRLGKVEDAEGYTVDVLAVKLKNAGTLERARTLQRNFVARYLNGGRGDALRDAALVAFYADGTPDWRFSLVRMDYTVDETKSKVRKDFTPARRYSFLVGGNEKTHTARKQLATLLQGGAQTTLGELERAFNIESVTKEFFEKYKTLYLNLKEELDGLEQRDPRIRGEFTAKHIDTATFAKRLLGQIVFLYFLQKKGWLGVGRNGDGSLEPWGTGPKDFLQRLFNKQVVPYENFFDDLLEPLFYEALASDRGEQSFYSRFACRIPFLNGGLFEPVGDYNWAETRINLLNETFGQIFDTFDLYNFTVREDEPLDKEVAVDPEMLGKVFENLLEVKDRKSKGAFYTPREIVHYMCQESLINYLDTALNTVTRPLLKQAPSQADLFGRPRTEQAPLSEEVYEERVPRADLAEFIRLGDAAQEHDAATATRVRETDAYSFKVPEGVRQHAKQLDEALANIKICDPAIGSGAFPVGMMNEIVRARGALKPYLGQVNATRRSHLPEDRTAYDFKRHAIQESIYGVDIEESAVDIAKLRLWLSLIVDEDDYGTIKPLPNLEYKIVIGNSLLGVEETLFNNDLFEKLERLKEQYFSETRQGEKGRLRTQVDALITELTQDGKFDFKVYFSEVFKQRLVPQHAYHVTWVTHNSRVSERMVTFGVKRGEPVLLDQEQEVELTRHLADIIRKDGLQVLAYNICRDHVHLVLVCSQDARDNLVRKLKGKSTQRYKQHHGVTEPLNLWAQKYHHTRLETDEQLYNTLHYVTHNREKHQLPENKGLQPLVQTMLTPQNRAFEPVMVGRGGFDIVIGNPPYVRQESLGTLKPVFKRNYSAYHGSADLYAYFIERGVKLLGRRGTFCYIVANKWMRANYGKPLRQWLKKQGLTKVIDFGDLPVFETATTYPCIMFVQNQARTDELDAVKVTTLEFGDLHNYVENHRHTISRKVLADDGWSLAQGETQMLLDKLRTVGKPLGEYVNGKIYYGIKTGLNEAFVIDAKTRQKLIEEDPKSEEVIKPFLAGRDIKKYKSPKSKNFLVFAFRGFDLEEYPAIKNHLSQFKDRLIPKPNGWTGENWQGRKPGPYKWYEIQDTVAYYAEFEKPKILFPDISTQGNFTLDVKGEYYSANTTYLIPDGSKYLLGIMNSQLMTFIYSNAFAVYSGGFLRFFRQYVEQLPIRTINPSDPTDQAMHDRMVALVERMLSLHEEKGQNAGARSVAEVDAEIRRTDAEIDALVYRLYGLTEEEIRIVEGGA